MTTIGPITLDVPVRYTRRGYEIEVFGTVNTLAQLTQLKELFAKAEAGSAIHDDIPGERPIGEDLTEDHQNTQYCAWTHGEKPQDGFYLLRGIQTFEDDTPVGFAYSFSMSLFWMGTDSYYQDGARAKNMEHLENDWEEIE